MRLIFDEILIASVNEKRARRVRFHPSMTLIRGRNGTGKSTLLKNLMLAFGACPPKLSKTWTTAGVRTLVRFRCGDGAYALLRVADRYSLFEEPSGKLIENFDSISKGLAARLAGLLRFHLHLPSQSGNVEQLPPAFYFLPYYMDQDASWTNSWAGFMNLGQFPRWRGSVIEYHAGIRGNDFYEAQGRKVAAAAELGRAVSKHSYLEEVYRDLASKYEKARFQIDIDLYESEIRDLLTKCEDLRKKQEKFKNTLVSLRNRKSNLEARVDIAKAARREADRDFAFASSVLQEHVDCPVCGAGYENSFRDQFSIALDSRECADLVIEYSLEVLELEKEIRAKASKVESTESEIAEIQRLLGHREGEIALADLIRQEGRRELKEAMGESLQALRISIRNLEKDIDEAKAAMKQATSPELRRSVEEHFGRLIARTTQLLSTRWDEGTKVSVTASMKAGGSEAPRVLLAYQVALMGVVDRFTSCAKAPLVVDTPKQQDQDPANYEAMLRVIRDEIPPGQQRILAVVDTDGFQFSGSEVTLDEKNHLLSGREYSEVALGLERYLSQGALGL